MIEERLYSTGNEDLDYILEKAFCDGFEYAQKEYASKYEEDDDDEDDIDYEDYEDLSDEKLKHMTENQKSMLIEDERTKARKNSAKLVAKYSKKRGKEGRKEGKRKGTRNGAITGGIIGAFPGVGIAANSNTSLKNKALITAGFAAGGAGLGALVGRGIGADNGEAEGRRRGAAEGRKKANKLGHNEETIGFGIARRLDEDARKRRKPDHYETDLRERYRVEKEKEEERNRENKRLEIERRKATAEEERARAQAMDARTNRYRYIDETFDRYYNNK